MLIRGLTNIIPEAVDNIDIQVLQIIANKYRFNNFDSSVIPVYLVNKLLINYIYDFCLSTRFGSFQSDLSILKRNV